MSDKIYRTVTYEIEPSGDCKRCKARAKSYNHCMAFNDFILNTAWNGDVKYYQLEKCKDYLSQEKAKVYCEGCMHFWAKTMLGELEPRCVYDHEQEGEMYNYYCINCTDREE